MAEENTSKRPYNKKQVVDEAKIETAEEPKSETETVEEVKEEPIEEVVGELVDMVTVTVPKDYILRPEHHTELKFKAGVQQMERKLAEHWYSVANGVEIYDPKAEAQRVAALHQPE